MESARRTSNDVAERLNGHMMKYTAQWKEQYNHNQRTLQQQHQKYKKSAEDNVQQQRDMHRGILNVKTNAEELMSQYKEEMKLELDKMKMDFEKEKSEIYNRNSSSSNNNNANDNLNNNVQLRKLEQKQEKIFQQMIRDTKDELISYVDENVKIINSIDDDDDGDNSKGIATSSKAGNTNSPSRNEGEERRAEPERLQTHQQHVQKQQQQQQRQVIEMTKKELYHHIDTVESKVENGYNVLYEYIDKSIDTVSKQFVKDINVNKQYADSTLNKLNEDVQRNTEMVKNNQNNIARLFDRRNDRVLAPPEKVKSSGNNNDRDDIVAMEEMNDNDNNNNNLKKREIASKRLAKRLALELKRHESGSSDDINENRKLDKNSKIHLHRSGSVTITSGGGSSSNNNNKMEEQNVVYDNNNNTQTPLDDELDSVLEQISQVHKLVNSTNQQFNVLQTKLNEADKLKLGKKKLKKRRGKKSGSSGSIGNRKKRVYNVKRRGGGGGSGGKGKSKKVLLDGDGFPLWRNR